MLQDSWFQVGSTFAPYFSTIELSIETKNGNSDFRTRFLYTFKQDRIAR